MVQGFGDVRNWYTQMLQRKHSNLEGFPTKSRVAKIVLRTNQLCLPVAEKHKVQINYCLVDWQIHYPFYWNMFTEKLFSPKQLTIEVI